MRLCNVLAVGVAVLASAAWAGETTGGLTKQQQEALKKQQEQQQKNQKAQKAKLEAAQKAREAEIQADQSAVETAAGELKSAREALEKARKEATELQNRLTREFETGTEYTGALQEAKEAVAKLEAARTPVVEAVKARPAYQAAAAKERAAQEKLSKVRNSDAPREAMEAASKEVLDAGAEPSRMIAQACAADANVTACQKACTDANAKVARVKADFKKSLEGSGELKNARDAIAAAQTKYNEASAKHTAAVNRLAAARSKPLTY